MIVLGISGGPDLVHENLFGLTPYQDHDSACVLVEDGEVRFAIEEERLNRIKHTNKFPHQAIRFCLESRSIGIDDVDLVAFYHCAEIVDLAAKQLFLTSPRAAVLHDAAGLFQHLLAKGPAGQVPVEKLRFVHHHHAHAVSAFAMSGFERALVITIDGAGDLSSGVVMTGGPGGLEQLANFPVEKSLGHFYTEAIAYLGYGKFDEYKVMGLAPYGDPAVYGDAFRSLYRLLPGGDYQLNPAGLFRLFEVMRPRRKGEPFTRQHQDVAAAVQGALEEIAFHVVRHWQQATGERNLCLAGGVAHNCTLNGKLLSSGLFENVFVQPAAHDAGCALGAALHAYHQARPEAPRGELAHVFWGTDVGGADEVLATLTAWGDFLSFERVERIAGRTAQLLAEGSVVGWVQGRSEFGPRALGSRSIVADPRPLQNKERINQMVKKREGYRPFAPSVLEEHVADWFVVPAGGQRFPFMIFVVPVRADKRELLGAITHVDGTARIQTVDRGPNARYWELIEEFRKITGVPMVLNTSFNNDVEPIVDSVQDAIVCFLTTNLDRLVVGDYLVAKKPPAAEAFLALRPSLPAHVRLAATRRLDPDGGPTERLAMENSYDAEFRRDLPRPLFDLLSRADGRQTLGELLAQMDGGVERGAKRGEEAAAMVDAMAELWSRRLVALTP